jgi:hypothetical protein
MPPAQRVPSTRTRLCAPCGHYEARRVFERSTSLSARLPRTTPVVAFARIANVEFERSRYPRTREGGRVRGRASAAVYGVGVYPDQSVDQSMTP